MIERDRLFIDGAWVSPEGGGRLEVTDASTEEVFATIPEGTPADVDKAVAAARRAFPAWSATPVEVRAKHLRALSEGLSARMDEVGALVSREVGMPRALAVRIQGGLPARNLGLFAELLDTYEFEERIGNTLVVREPVGVVGAITPWNYPLHQIAAKIGGAFAAGCTVVVKPSEVAPLSAFVLAEVAEAAGLPAGVLNVVSGTGPVVGEAIAAHPDVDMVSFTGSTAAGKRVSEVAAKTVKRVALELGGKSANIILDDADLERCVPPGVGGCYLNSGQTCTALTRMLVPRHLQDRVVELARARAESITVGPADTEVELGPLISDTQRERVRSYIRKGVEEGATLVTGGDEPPEGLDRGYFVRPTVFADVTPDMTIAREEIFGPVLSIMPYDSEDEAVAIANDTDYGLSGAVQSASTERAMAVARRLRTGQVGINGGVNTLRVPFGGYKQSGNGREMGRYGLEEFLETKSIGLPR